MDAPWNLVAFFISLLVQGLDITRPSLTRKPIPKAWVQVEECFFISFNINLFLKNSINSLFYKYNIFEGIHFYNTGRFTIPLRNERHQKMIFEEKKG